MYKSTQSPAWFKKSLLVTSLLAAIYQTTAGAADTTAHTTTSDTSSDSSEQMTVTAPAPLLKAGSEHSVSAQELQDKGAKDFGSVMRYEPLIGATGASGGSGMVKAASTAAAIPVITFAGWKATASGLMSTASRSRMRPGASTSAVPA